MKEDNLLTIKKLTDSGYISEMSKVNHGIESFEVIGNNENDTTGLKLSQNNIEFTDSLFSYLED